MQTLEEQLEISRDHFITHFGEVPTFIAHAPGRINLIGEHTDYNLGLSLPCAINNWIMVSIKPRNDKKIHVVSEDFHGEMQLELAESFKPCASWQHYIYGCLTLFQKTTPLHTGFQAVISGNVPIGSGISSSAALEVAFMNALNHTVGDPLDPMTLIKLCQQTEHQYLNVKSGLLDQYASQFSRADQAMILDFNSLSHQYITADTLDYVWVLCNSNVQRTLSGSKYSERVRETHNGFLTLQEQFPELKTIREVEEQHLPFLDHVVQQKRIRHYLSENQRVLDTVKAFSENNIQQVGRLLTASHKSLRYDYEVSCPELDYLVEEALSSGYCLGSRMMGGGFGGCTINLVHKDKIDEFRDTLEASYFKQFNKETEINSYQTVDGAGVSPVTKNVSHRI
ncbi:MAG: galactokinase [Cytophagaceae bacterium]|nr:galactokinase [Cytophagaceae bacterium]